MKKITLLFTILLLTMADLAFAQSQKITGKVSGIDGDELIGVLVQIKGTSVGAVTDFEGNYSIALPDSITNPVLVFSFLSYQTQEVAVGSSNTLDVLLLESSETLNEVVITAFGVSKDKRDLGYSTQSVSGSDLIKAREPNPIAGLTGKIAGLTIGTNTEMAGAPNVFLRGNSGILYVVDGVPINSDSWNISPDDIETYTVLKGPNAAALYGFRGQNGAIIITTKKGSKSRKGVSVEYNSSVMMDKGFISKPLSQSRFGIGNNYRYAFGNDPLDLDGNYRRAAVWGPRFDGQLVPQWDSPLDENGERTGTPWLSKGAKNFENFMQTGYLLTNNFSVGASTDKSDLRVSVTNSSQKGIAPNTGLSINNFNLSAGHSITPRLRIDGLANVNMQNSDNIPDVYYGPNSYAYSFGVYGGAHYDVRDLEEDYWLVDGVQQKNREYGRTNNPYFMANEWLRGHKKTDMYGYAKLSYKIDDYTNILIRTQATGWDALRTEKFPYSAEAYGRPDRKGDYQEDRRNLFESNNDILLTYDRDFSDFHFSGLWGATARSFSYNSSWQRTNNLVIPGVYNMSNSENPLIGYNFRSDMMVLSTYTSLDFGYKNYVRLNVTGHWDKLSTLPVGEQNYFYPSASASTILTNYLRKQIPEVISFAKVRGSFAQVQGGLVQNQIGPSFAAMGLARPLSYGGDWYTTYDGPSYQNQNTYSTSLLYNNQPASNFTNVLANSELQPFSVTAYETGIDLLFLKNRLGLDITYFTTLNGPQIFVRDVAPSTGHYQRNINDVITQKNGWEIALKGTPVLTDKFRWNVLVNYATFVERFKEINDPSGTVFLNNNFYEVGDRVDEAFGVNFVKDQNGNVIHDAAGMPIRPASGPQGATSLGFGNSKFVWAINNQFTYKNWFFSFQFDGRVGGNIINVLRRDAFRGGTHLELAEGAYGEARDKEWESLVADGAITPSYVSEGVRLIDGTIRFNEDGSIANYDELTFEENTQAVQLQPYVIHISGFDEPWVQSKTYAKLREVVISYSLPKKWFTNSFVENISIGLVGRNLIYFAKSNLKDIDMDQYPMPALQPHLEDGTRSTNNPRLQSASTRRYGFNINITL